MENTINLIRNVSGNLPGNLYKNLSRYLPGHLHRQLTNANLQSRLTFTHNLPGQLTMPTYNYTSVLNSTYPETYNYATEHNRTQQYLSRNLHLLIILPPLRPAQRRSLDPVCTHPPLVGGARNGSGATTRTISHLSLPTLEIKTKIEQPQGDTRNVLAIVYKPLPVFQIAI